MFVVIRDIDPRRRELIIRRLDGAPWITTADAESLVLHSKAEARALIETLMEQTMTIDFMTEEPEDA
jgi:hypothetical protein